jgi:hypothetical protein
LGNLTLTGYNSELSNGEFATKRSRFSQSLVHLNRSIALVERWDDHAIQRRGEELSELAVKAWPYFGPADGILANTADGGFTRKSPVAVAILGAKRPVSSWREVLQVTLETIRESEPDIFDEVVVQFPRLISNDAGKFRAPRMLNGGGLYFETNLSAENVARYCQQMTNAAGYSLDDWNVETR